MKRADWEVVLAVVAILAIFSLALAFWWRVFVR